MIVRKIKTAARILRDGGPTTLLRQMRQRLKHTTDVTRPDESRIAYEVLRAAQRKGIMIDVGAHYGSSLSPFAKSGWQVFAFEPDPKNRERLIESFGRLPNVSIDPRAVSNKQQRDITFYTSEESTGISGLSAFHRSHVPSYKVDSTTLESLVDEKGLTDVDFLKIDTEGFDLFVLKGVPWNRARLRLIVCEFEDSKTVPLGYTFHDLACFLADRGYNLIVSEWYPIKKYGGPHDWRCFNRYPSELHDTKAWGNIIAVRDSELYDLVLRICRKIENQQHYN
jgi:FkbM family methyltransferase